MKLYFCFFVVVITLLCVGYVFVPPDFVSAFERDAYVSVGISGEARYPDVGFYTSAETASDNPKEQEVSHNVNENVKEESAEDVAEDGEKENPSDEPLSEEDPEEPLPFSETEEGKEPLAEEENEIEEEKCATTEAALSIFSSGGTYQATSEDGFVPASALQVRESLCAAVTREECKEDFKSFAFTDRMSPLESPLNEEELAYVFSEIISSSTVAVPIRGELVEISFLAEENNLSASARIALSFEELAEKYNLTWLPPSAVFSLQVSFEVREGELIARSDAIELRCETFPLPRTLLLFGCSVAFGKKDYQKLFAQALKNVFVNAGIYR